jgi:hypothetical protein
MGESSGEEFHLPLLTLTAWSQQQISHYNIKVGFSNAATLLKGFTTSLRLRVRSKLQQAPVHAQNESAQSSQRKQLTSM